MLVKHSVFNQKKKENIIPMIFSVFILWKPKAESFIVNLGLYLCCRDRTRSSSTGTRPPRANPKWTIPPSQMRRSLTKWYGP